jgi:hypothetical protein
VRNSRKSLIVFLRVETENPVPVDGAFKGRHWSLTKLLLQKANLIRSWVLNFRFFFHRVLRDELLAEDRCRWRGGVFRRFVKLKEIILDGIPVTGRGGP